MRGIFLKTPMVRMGSQNHMRGDSLVLTSNTPLNGCALVSIQLRGPGGGGGGMVRRTGEPLPPNRADGERGGFGGFTGSPITGHVRPDSNGYVHRSGGSRGSNQYGSGTTLNATAGSQQAPASVLDISTASGGGGRGAWLYYPTVSNFTRTPATTAPQNPDSSDAGQGGWGGNMNSTDTNQAQPNGTTAGNASRAWMTILD